MARPSKLSPAQWAEVERREAEGESLSALAREFKVSVATISTRVSKVSENVRKVALKVADAQSALEGLPVRQQHQAISLADKLRNISNSLASAAELGAATSHRLQELAHREVAKVKGEDAAADGNALRCAAGLVQLANQAATIPMSLLAANKERVNQINAVESIAPTGEDEGDGLAITVRRRQ